MKFIFLVVFIIVSFYAAAPSFSETENYCDDPAVALEWEKLVEKNPNDLALQRLHALRLGICEKIAKGSLTFDQGMRIFEEEREKAVRKRFEEKRSKEKTRTF